MTVDVKVGDVVLIKIGVGFSLSGKAVSISSVNNEHFTTPVGTRLGHYKYPLHIIEKVVKPLNPTEEAIKHLTSLGYKVEEPTPPREGIGVVYSFQLAAQDKVVTAIMDQNAWGTYYEKDEKYTKIATVKWVEGEYV